MERRILWVAVLLYLVGIAIVLYVRPESMFHASGKWKEFGVNHGARYTVLPVWLFAVVWAIVSYGLTLAFFGAMAQVALASAGLPPQQPMQRPIARPMDADVEKRVYRAVSEALGYHPQGAAPDPREFYGGGRRF